MKNAPNKSTDDQNVPEHSIEHSSEMQKCRNQGSVLHSDLILALKNSISVLCTLQVTLFLFDLFYFLAVTFFWLFWNFIIHYPGLSPMTCENLILILYLNQTWQISWKIKFLRECVKNWMNNQVRIDFFLSLVRTCKLNKKKKKKKSKIIETTRLILKLVFFKDGTFFLPKISQSVLIMNTRHRFFQGRA